MIVTPHFEAENSCYFKLNFGHTVKYVRIYRVGLEDPRVNAGALFKAIREARRDSPAPWDSLISG